MNDIKIDNSKHFLYGLFQELYVTSFPVFEQRTETQQQTAFLHPNYYLEGYQENGVFIGFISYWEFEKYVYIEHFAVNQSLRGRGCGSVILKKLISSKEPKMVLLEIDPIVDNVSEARLRFYQKCGFYENSHTHIHPPYRNQCKPHSLIILTTKRKITDDEYHLFYNELVEVVMMQSELSQIN